MVMRRAAWLWLLLLASGDADATRTRAASCVASAAHLISLPSEVVVDQVVVRMTGPEGEVGPRVSVGAQRFERVLSAPAPGENALRFFPGLRSGTFRVVVGATPSRSSCVQEVTLASGPLIVATVRP